MSEVLDVAPVTAEEIKAGLLAGFPFPEIRPTQDSALGAIARSRVEKKKFTILELPTGVGKSGCAVAAAQYATTLPSSPPFARGAYFLTSQKSLQSQLMNDFSKLGLVELKGKNNYKCINTLAAGVDCETASNGFGETCADCPYRTAKTIFGNSPME